MDSSAALLRLATLKIDRARGNAAPHKPPLLLAVLDLIDAGRLTPPTISPSAELTYQFLTYWRIVAHRRACSGPRTSAETNLLGILIPG